MVYKRKQQTFAVQKQASMQALIEGMEVAADTQISMKPFRNVNALLFFFVLLCQNELYVRQKILVTNKSLKPLWFHKRRINL